MRDPWLLSATASSSRCVPHRSAAGLALTLLLAHQALAGDARPADGPPRPRRIDARLMRMPDVSADRIAFVYAGDIWVVGKKGGVAQRLSSPKGEESFPKFSPDGQWIAFSGNYDGNLDVYVVPTVGGVPRRVTHHGAPDRVLGWFPDGKNILYATSMTSEKDRFNQLYKVAATGGLPEKLPVPYGEFGEISPDGKSLAYTPISLDFRTWKRYRGGMVPDIWLFDLEKLEARNVTKSDANDSIPMWHGDTLYFLSDRDAAKRCNLWAYDLKQDQFRQLTTFTDFDVRFPSIGPKDLVFEAGGRLYLLDLESGKTEDVDVRVITDRLTLKPRLESVSKLVQNSAISPTGKRALFEARGDIFSVPAEHGVVRNLTRTPGVAERFPTWSPDGKRLAWFTDRDGEYELAVRNADGTGEETLVTRLGPGFRYRPQWSPDSRKLVFIDQAMKIHLCDVEARQADVIDRQLWMYHGDLDGFTVNWSPDSRWIAYAGELENRNTALVLYDTREAKRHQVTSGFYADDLPVFDPDGKYLYFRTSRTFTPIYSDLDATWIYANSLVLAAVPLKQDTLSPIAPRNDEEGDPKKDDKKEDKKDGKDEGEKGEKKAGSSEDTPAPDEPGDAAAKPASVKAEPAKPAGKPDDKKEPKPVEIDLEGFESRVVVLPMKAGRYDSLAAVSGKLLFRRLPRTGADDEKSPVAFWDLEKREEKVVIEDVDAVEQSANREKLLVRKGKDFAIIEPKEGQKFDKKLNLASLDATVDPQAEWRQIFTDAWRFERDMFYDPNMHGVDWKAMRERYGRLLDDAVTRWDVSFVIGELIAELNASHTYRGGGDVEDAPTRGVGYLGCDFALEDGFYRIKRILSGAPWDAEVRSPLKQPGVAVKEGDYLIAVNGEPVDTSEDPWAAFQGLADKPVLLTVSTKPSRDGTTNVLVQTLGSEARLRHLAWIDANRRRVEQASDGRIGYVYVPDTGRNGQNELVRQWRGQITRQGLIIDERFNSGGQIPDRFIELLNRPLRNLWGVRDGRDWPWPPVSHFGPKAMLINGWSGSGGDCFPYYFKQSGLGPLIGTRTWGGLIGITGAPPLIDGGNVTVPTFGIYDVKEGWIVEGAGVTPDIEVIDDPALMARGSDPQLERAIAEVLAALEKQPPQPIRKPAYPDRAR